MAVSGKNFFSSAWSGFLLNLKHGIVFIWAIFLAKLFITLGKVGITVVNVYTCYLFMQMRGDLAEPGMNPKVPLIFVAFFTYFVQNIFLGMFDQGVIGMLTCVGCDKDLN